MTEKPILIEEIFWDDSVHDTGWQDIQDVKDHAKEIWTIKCKTVGYVIEETDEYLLLAMSLNPWGEEWQVSETMQIPQSAITKRKQLL